MTCLQNRVATTDCCAYASRPTSPSSSHRSSKRSSRILFPRRQFPQLRSEGTDLAETGDVTASSPSGNVPTAREWEIDFSSRPLLDERKKKVWELLLCDPTQSFKFSQYFANNQVNSASLNKCISALIDQDGAKIPRRAKFFRGQMKTIISRALMDLDIPVVPSRRCFALTRWLNERMENVYPNDPRYSPEAQQLFTADVGPPESPPDIVRGETWDYVQLPLGVLLNETKDITDGNIFGAGIELELVGLGDLSMDTLIPGVSVYSRRAEPLAAWMNAYELSSLVADVDRSCLILETGVSERWRYGRFKPSKQANEQAMLWERAKGRSKGLHFLTVQDDPEAEYCFGLWLMIHEPTTT